MSAGTARTGFGLRLPSILLYRRSTYGRRPTEAANSDYRVLEVHMSQALRDRLYGELDALVLVDPHTHINPLAPASQTLADLLGYHYYTELAHSAGMPRERIEEPGLPAKEKVGRLVERLGALDNTIQYSWLIELAREFFGFPAERLTLDNWERLYDVAQQAMQRPTWASDVLKKSGLRGVFLTNDFDDPLEGFDRNVYIPCLRTDDLVFHLGLPEVRQRIERCASGAIHNAASLTAALGGRFEHFTKAGAKACAISLPPDFCPGPVGQVEADGAIQAAWRGQPLDDQQRTALSKFVFWKLAELCAEYRLPFDLMIGVNRSVYVAGVFQGRDLFDGRVSLIQYRELLNAFPQVTFPISVLASATNQELASYSWIFPNVVTNGHWWYSNTPPFIELDAAARLEAVPRTKQIGYYSDMYKLEFGLPKFRMYKRILAKVLAERFVIDRGWSESRAVELGRQVLCDNTHSIFNVR